jgi:hypothetical protein
MSAFDKIKSLLGIQDTRQTQAAKAQAETQAVASEQAKSSFLANQSADRAAKLAEVQDKADKGIAD